MTPSPGSIKGQRFIGAGKNSDGIPNLGQMTCESVIETGDTCQTNFDAAEVRKPLLAVSDLNGRENPCWFDGEQSYIIPAGSAEIPELRALIQKVNGRSHPALFKGRDGRSRFPSRPWPKDACKTP